MNNDDLNKMLFDEAKERIARLKASQDLFDRALFGDLPKDKHAIDLDPTISLPAINEFQFQDCKVSLGQPDAFDDDVLAKWRTADIPVTVGAGVLGALASWALRDVFNSWHKKWGATDALNGGHGGQGIDLAPGSAGPGGGKHRFKFGHDLFNPFEVDWNEYKDLAQSSGTSLPLWLKGGFYWLRHLYQDTFSNEGLPLPGHSLLRNLIDPTPEQIKAFLTIKARDVVGAGLTNVILIGYLWGTEGGISRVVGRENFRVYTILMAGNFVNLASGFFIPPPATTLNWSTIPIIARYLWKLYKLDKKVKSVLDARDRVFDENDLKLEECFKQVARNNDELEKMWKEVKTFHDQVEHFYVQTDERQENLMKRIFRNQQQEQRRISQ